MDYRAFLKPIEPVVLPYFGGTRLDASDRRLRLDRAALGVIGPGWWRFRIDGRRAVPLEPAAPVELGNRPALRGHWAEGCLFSTGRDVARVALPPIEEPAPLARCTGRRWHAGELLLDAIDFEDDAELEARRALEDGAAIAAVRGVAPSLRAAFGFAVIAAVGRELGVAVSPREVAGRVLAIAEGGRDAARAVLDDLIAERRRHVADRSTAPAAVRSRVRVRSGDPVARANEVLEAAGARMLRARRLGDERLEVRFECEGERFVTVVDAATFQVLDAGICLAGADREVTLDSLPSVIREAIELDHLNITRH